MQHIMNLRSTHIHALEHAGGWRCCRFPWWWHDLSIIDGSQDHGMLTSAS